MSGSTSLKAELATQIAALRRYAFVLAGNRADAEDLVQECLARAIAADSSVLVMVDPTTAVDSVTESNVAERLGQARTDGLTLVFTDAPAHLAAADEVIVLAEGRLVHRGAADEVPALSSAVPAGTPVEAHR